jgi:hypothetical protein
MLQSTEWRLHGNKGQFRRHIFATSGTKPMQIEPASYASRTVAKLLPAIWYLSCLRPVSTPLAPDAEKTEQHRH